MDEVISGSGDIRLIWAGGKEGRWLSFLLAPGAFDIARI